MREAEGFYDKQAWKKCRAAFIAERRGIDGGMCQICGEVPGVIVHHKIRLNKFNREDPDIAFGFKNLQLLCHHCHDVVHGYAGRQKDESRVVFDDMGNALEKIF